MSDLLILPSNVSVKPPMPPTQPAAAPQSDGAPSIEWLKANCKSQLIGYLLFITPEMAAAFLLANIGNRSVKRRHLARLRAAMRNGEWAVTHQGICFSVTGVLLDGQHRLMAIIESGVGQLVHVFTGLPDEVRNKMDNGVKPRELRDLIDGDPAYIDACAFLANLMITNQDRPPSVEEVEEIMDALEPDLDALQNAAATRVKGRTPAPVRSVWAVRHHMANKTGKKLLREQWKAFVSFVGMDIMTSSAARRLEKLNNSTGSGTARERAMIAWVAFDPKERTKTKVQISSDKPIWDIRDALSDILEEEIP